MCNALRHTVHPLIGGVTISPFRGDAIPAGMILSACRVERLCRGGVPVEIVNPYPGPGGLRNEEFRQDSYLLKT